MSSTSPYDDPRALTAVAAGSSSPPTSGPQLRKSGARPASAATGTRTTANNAAVVPFASSASHRPLTSTAAAATNHLEIDTDSDYITVSYVLNPPLITVVGYFEDVQLTALADRILSDCVDRARIAACRDGPPTFVRQPRTIGIFPVYTLSLARWFFNEAQEMALALAILEAVADMQSFRMVPMDGQCEKDSQSSAVEQRLKSKNMLNMGAARAVDFGGDAIHHAAARRSAQYFFLPK